MISYAFHACQTTELMHMIIKCYHSKIYQNRSENAHAPRKREEETNILYYIELLTWLTHSNLKRGRKWITHSHTSTYSWWNNSFWNWSRRSKLHMFRLLMLLLLMCGYFIPLELPFQFSKSINDKARSRKIKQNTTLFIYSHRNS